MSDDNQNQNENANDVIDTTVADAEGEIASLQAKIKAQQDILDKARKGENFHRNTAKDLQAQLDALSKESSKYKELYDVASKRVKEFETEKVNGVIDKALTQALDSEATSVSTVLKLIDRSGLTLKEDGTLDGEAIKNAIDKVRASDPVLFKQKTEKTGVKTPDIKRPAEGNPVSGYEQEIRMAKTQKEVQAVIDKYGKGK